MAAPLGSTINGNMLYYLGLSVGESGKKGIHMFKACELYTNIQNIFLKTKMHKNC